MVQRRYGVLDSIGWDQILMSVSANEEVAWNTFCELWDEFIKQPDDYCESLDSIEEFISQLGDADDDEDGD